MLLDRATVTEKQKSMRLSTSTHGPARLSINHNSHNFGLPKQPHAQPVEPQNFFAFCCLPKQPHAQPVKP